MFQSVFSRRSKVTLYIQTSEGRRLLGELHKQILCSPLSFLLVSVSLNDPGPLYGFLHCFLSPHLSSPSVSVSVPPLSPSLSPSLSPPSFWLHSRSSGPETPRWRSEGQHWSVACRCSGARSSPVLVPRMHHGWTPPGRVWGGTRSRCRGTSTPGRDRWGRWHGVRAPKICPRPRHRDTAGTQRPDWLDWWSTGPAKTQDREY